jgi:hypothetical protein
MDVRIFAVAVAAVAVLAAGCSSPAVPLPACSKGTGANGSVATLSIRQHGDAFTGVYLVTRPGMPAGSAFRYDITGRASGGHLTSLWTLGTVALRVSGRYTARTIRLGNPSGRFSVTVFRAASGCPTT